MSSSIFRSARRLIPLLAAVGYAVPALACPVCMGSAGQQVLYTYFATAAALTLAAFGSVATIGIWLHRRYKAADALPEGDA